MSLADYQLLVQLGEGQDGHCYQAKHISSGKLVEVRLLHELHNSEKHLGYLVGRVRQISLLRHRSVLRIEKSQLEEKKPYIALEWFQGKRLDILFEETPFPLTLKETLVVLREIISLLSLSHRVGVVHNHLSPNRVILSLSKRIKVDFINLDTFSSRDTFFTEEGLAPYDEQNPETDIYYLAKLSLWMFKASTSKEILKTSLWQTRGDTLDHSVGESFVTLLNEMLSEDILSRPTVFDIERRFFAIYQKITSLSSPMSTRLSSLSPSVSHMAETRLPFQNASAKVKNISSSNHKAQKSSKKAANQSIEIQEDLLSAKPTKEVLAPQGVLLQAKKHSERLQKKAISLIQSRTIDPNSSVPLLGNEEVHTQKNIVTRPDPNALTKNVSSAPDPNALTKNVSENSRFSSRQNLPVLRTPDPNAMTKNAPSTRDPNSLARNIEQQPFPQKSSSAVALDDFDESNEKTSVDIRFAPKDKHEVFSHTHLRQYRLLEQIGEGGLGVVYRAEDTQNAKIVAVKIIQQQWAQEKEVLDRFQKEGRLLAEVKNPYVANLIEVGEDDGVYFIAMEFVAGKTLRQLLDQQRSLSEKHALIIMADVARALIDAHARGIVHRDIKPDNILLVQEDMNQNETNRKDPHVKLSDFGLARHVDQSLSLAVTRPGGPIGTPLYMSPEQCEEVLQIDSRADVYAMGATLFHLVTGQPPFEADTLVKLTMMHCHEPPPDLKKLNPTLSDGFVEVVKKCLAKAPQARYADAGALLLDLERLLSGEPMSIQAHPQVPEHDPAQLIHVEYSVDLKTSPEKLWPYISNTDRLNRIWGNPAIDYSYHPDPIKGVRRVGKLRMAGLEMIWEEYPYEWVAGRRIDAIRDFQKGPFHWLSNSFEIFSRPGGGARITSHLKFHPKGFLGRLIAKIQAGAKARKKWESAYHHIDMVLQSKKINQPDVDPFEPPAKLSTSIQKRITSLTERLLSFDLESVVVQHLGDFLQSAPVHELARIRPLVFARRFSLSQQEVISTFIYAAREGLLELLWDILCPVCRVPAQIQSSLQTIKDHGYCEVCDLDFELDFSKSVELIFRVHPEIRTTEIGTYCIGSPARFPHVISQTRVSPGERIEIDLALSEGSYRIRGLAPFLFSMDILVTPDAKGKLLELLLARVPEAGAPRLLQPGHQLLVLENKLDIPLMIRLERAIERDDVLTAAQASANKVFRENFPKEVLSAKQLVNITTTTFLLTELAEANRLYENLGDQSAFTVFHEHFARLEKCIQREGGIIVKTLGAGVLAVFHHSTSAFRAGLSLRDTLDRDQKMRGLGVRAGIHRGPAMVTMLNNQIDYFGLTIQQLNRIPSLAQNGEVLVSQEVLSDPDINAFLQERGLSSENLQTIPCQLPSLEKLYRIVFDVYAPNMMETENTLIKNNSQ